MIENFKSIYQYILYTSMYWYRNLKVYHGIWRYMQVQSGIWRYMLVWGRVQTSTYWYILVHQCTYFDHLFCSPPRRCCTLLARLKAADWPLPQDTLVHTHTLVYSSSVLTSCPPVSACQWWQGGGGGSGQVRCLARRGSDVPDPLM